MTSRQRHFLKSFSLGRKSRTRPPGSGNITAKFMGNHGILYIHVCMYILYIAAEDIWYVRNWGGSYLVPQSHSTFWGLTPFPTPHLFLIAKCFTCNAYLVGVSWGWDQNTSLGWVGDRNTSFTCWGWDRGCIRYNLCVCLLLLHSFFLQSKQGKQAKLWDP